MLSISVGTRLRSIVASAIGPAELASSAFICRRTGCALACTRQWVGVARGAGVTIIAADRVVGVHTTGTRVTAVIGTSHTIIDVGSGSRLAIIGGVAGFRPIAELTVIAVGVVGRVDDDIVCLVARIVRTPDTVVEVGRNSALAIVGGIAGLRPIAELSIVAVGIVDGVDHDIVYLVATVVRTQIVIVALFVWVFTDSRLCVACIDGTTITIRTGFRGVQAILSQCAILALGLVTT